jgi:hypothetical protein
MSDDTEMETFLRQFQPRAPGPLRPARPPRTRLWLATATVAAALVLAPFWWLMTGRRAPPALIVADHPLTPTRALLAAAMRVGNHEAVLDQLDAAVLPDPTREGGALRVLGDASRDY